MLTSARPCPSGGIDSAVTVAATASRHAAYMLGMTSVLTTWRTSRKQHTTRLNPSDNLRRYPRTILRPARALPCRGRHAGPGRPRSPGDVDILNQPGRPRAADVHHETQTPQEAEEGSARRRRRAQQQPGTRLDFERAFGRRGGPRGEAGSDVRADALPRGDVLGAVGCERRAEVHLSRRLCGQGLFQSGDLHTAHVSKSKVSRQ